jgi:tetratricopeptide (TPR) repeat protein
MIGITRFSRAPLGILIAALALATVAAPLRAEPSQTSPAPVASGAQTSQSPVDHARSQVAQGHLDAAIRDLAAYVNAHPNDVDAARYLGDLYYRKADLASAETVYLSILRLRPNDHETHNRLGGIYAAQDRISDAIREFTASLPTSGAYDRLVELHALVGDLRSFETQYVFQADSQPHDAVDQYNAGAIFHAERKYTDAIEYLKRALILEPNECAILSELGSTYLDLDDLHAAQGYLDSCLHEEPNYYPALVNSADVQIEFDRFDSAKTELDRAHGVRPDGAEALVDLGYLEDAGQRWRPAIAYYLQALSLDPLMREAYVNLGYDYDEHQLYALAEAAFLKGLSIAPNDGRLHYLLGVTYADQGKVTLAMQEYQRAAKSDELDVAKAATRELALLHKSG